jgi:hypothetical protein
MLPAVLLVSKYTWFQFRLFLKKLYPFLYFDFFLYGPIPVNNGWRASCDRHITFSEKKQDLQSLPL